MTDLEKMRGPLALTAHRQINCEHGGATVFCVVLADGFILDCGSDGYAQKRADLLADMINRCEPDRFDFANARKAKP